MKIIPENELESNAWDLAQLSHDHPSFLQSWAWGEFQKQVGNQIFRIAVGNDDNIILLQAQAILQGIGLGQRLLYLPRVNLIKKQLPAQDQEQALRVLMDHIVSVATNVGATFIRIDPPTLDTDLSSNFIYKSLGFIPNQKKSIQPQYNQFIKLESDLDKTLQQAKPKTKYNTQLGIKNYDNNNLQVSTVVEDKSIDTFLQLIHTTSQHQGFTAHSDTYFTKQIQELSRSGIAELITTTHQDDPVGAIFVIYFGNTATYLHGASNPTYRNLMGSYLLHSIAIQHSIAKGLTHYDLGGVHPDPKHPWSGITRFKQSFGGQMVKYTGTLELPISKFKYSIYRLINKLR
ncbi:MAG: peptidoglycan bridge formation glycyltransferase FemA/FemB family protein [Patescibacteria group bacterium]